jgi:hypothetical protein
MTPRVYYKSFLETYEESEDATNMPKMGGPPSADEIVGLPVTNESYEIKEIENRIYVDLWNEDIPSDNSLNQRQFKITRKITVGFLKKGKFNTYNLYKYPDVVPDYQHFDEMQLVLTADPKDTGKILYIDGSASGYPFTSKDSPANCAIIPIDRMHPEYLVQCTLHILCSEENISGEGNEGKIEITGHLIHKINGRDEIIGTESRREMTLCRCPDAANEDEPFEVLRDGDKDVGIFVMPRVCQEEKHKPYIRKLQLYSNQVLARHNGIQQVQNERFDFVKEDGIYTRQLGINYMMSIPIFQATRKPNPLPSSGLHNNLPHNFSTFGQMQSLVDYLISDYGTDDQTVKELVFDRNFIYGSNTQQTGIANIQGLNNIYERVVQVFRSRFIEEAQNHVDFPHRWMPRPNLAHYRRGKLTVESGMNLQVYDQEEGGSIVQVGGYSILPQNAEITFAIAHDEFCDTTATHRYRIESIKIGTQTYSFQDNILRYIPLTYANKKLCKDNEEVDNDVNFGDNKRNYCDYMVLPVTGRDIDHLRYYRAHYGVPYYISESNTITGGRIPYTNFCQPLSNSVTNWYSYNDSSRPNLPSDHSIENRLKGIGLDCTGLIWNCLLDTTYSRDDVTKFLADRGNYRGNENSIKVGSTRARLIPLDARYRNGDDLLVQAGDLIYSTDNANRHIAIALCTANAIEAINLDMHLTEMQKNDRYFTIIHNYGGEGIRLDNGNWHIDGFFRKTLKGPFRHWNVELDNTTGTNKVSVGRIYLWY